MRGELSVRFARLLSLAVSFLALSGEYCAATDLLSPQLISFQPLDTAARPNSVMVFAGRMSVNNFHDTLLFNLNRPGIGYDNYTAGAAYARDLLNPGLGFHLGVEVGVADRFGHYNECCGTVITSPAIVHTAELWVGPQLRYDGILVYDLVRIGGSLTVGFSAVSGSIGREQERRIIEQGNARLLYYLAPELDFSTPGAAEYELFMRVQHRSGGKLLSFLPTLGNLGEGYNANVGGLRYRF